MGRVSGKVAIVTGGARGLGESFVRLLAAEGAKVMCTDVLDREGATLAGALDGVRFMHHDVVRRDDWHRVVEATEAALGPVSVLVNNAGIGGAAPLESYPEKDFRRVMDINVLGVFLGMQSVIPSMRRAGGGSIINISSTSGLRGVPHTTAYTASKFAVCGMTKTAALELAADSIRVNSVHPGPSKTPILMEAPDVIEAVLQQVPAHRLGEPTEIANMVLLLASDDMKFATGAEFVVDGGLTCR